MDKNKRDRIMRNTNSNKGSVLVLSFMFIIILLLTGLCLYMSISHVSRELLFDETNYVNGYYAAIAALRYADVLLADPAVNLGFTDPTAVETFDTDLLNPLDASDRPFINAYAAFCQDIGACPDRLTLRIEEPNPNPSEYDVSATYSY